MSKKAKESIIARLSKRTGSKRAEFAKTIPENVAKSLDVTIEDYGSEKPLPLNRPNADYFNSSLHLRNMNIIDPDPNVVSSIFLYDERSGGKDGNSVCSVRWEALMIKHRKHAINGTTPETHHVGIYDNCCGQKIELGVQV